MGLEISTEARQSHDAAVRAVAVGSSRVDVTAFMGGPTHGALSLDRRRTHGQRRALREMPSRSQLRRRGGHRQPEGLRGRGEFVLKADHRLNQLRQLHHLHRRKHDLRGNLTVGNRIARAGGGRVMLIAIMLLVMAFGATSLHHANIRPITAHRSRDHQGQHQKCEDLPEAFHWRSGGKTRRHRRMVKAGCLFRDRHYFTSSSASQASSCLRSPGSASPNRHTFPV